MKKNYQFSAKVWRYSSDAASWYFVYVDPSIADEIKALVTAKKIRTKAFSFVPVEVKVGTSVWRTTLFPSKKEPYLLSINKKVRRAEGIDEGDCITVSFSLI